MKKNEALQLANDLNRGQVESVSSPWLFVAVGNRKGYEIRKYRRISDSWRLHGVHEEAKEE